VSNNIQENISPQLTFKLFLLGFCLIFVGILLIIIANVFSGSSVNFGGAIIIGPIPIVFGVGENAWLAILVAAVLTIVSMILFLWLRREGCRK